MTSIGTLFAFILVCAGVWIMRRAAAGHSARLHRAGAAAGRDARHRRLRRDDLRARLDQLAAARRLAGRSVWCSTSATASSTAGCKRTRPKPDAEPRRVTVVKGDRWFRAQGPVFAVALLLLIIAGGTVGYMLIEGWGAWDAFYMTVITVTTVGYEEVHQLSRAGQVFTVVLLLGGVGAALYTFTLLATVVVEGGPAQAAAAAAARHACSTRSRDHFIICGYGRIGSIVAEQFRRQRIPFVVIERDRGAAAGGDRATARWRRSRRQPRGRAEARRHRARARADRRGRHRRRERLRGAERARDAARSVHRRPRRDRGRDASS